VEGDEARLQEIPGIALAVEIVLPFVDLVADADLQRLRPEVGAELALIRRSDPPGKLFVRVVEPVAERDVCALGSCAFSAGVALDRPAAVSRG
jgi:hypothetical protein